MSDPRKIKRLIDWLEKQRQKNLDMVTDAGDASLWCKEEADLIRDHMKTVEAMATRLKAHEVTPRPAWDDETCLRFADAYDREDAAQRGEPNPHDEKGEGYAEWAMDRIACVRAGLAALPPAPEAQPTDWNAAAKDMLHAWNTWVGWEDEAHRLLLAASFAGQAFEDAASSGLTADSAPGRLLTAFLTALIDPDDPSLDPLRSCNRPDAQPVATPSSEAVSRAAQTLLDHIGDGWGPAVNAMTHVFRRDMDVTRCPGVSTANDAFFAALRALSGETA